MNGPVSSYLLSDPGYHPDPGVELAALLDGLVIYLRSYNPIIYGAREGGRSAEPLVAGGAHALACRCVAREFSAPGCGAGTTERVIRTLALWCSHPFATPRFHNASSARQSGKPLWIKGRPKPPF